MLWYNQHDPMLRNLSLLSSSSSSSAESNANVADVDVRSCSNYYEMMTRGTKSTSQNTAADPVVVVVVAAAAVTLDCNKME
jgi:hypothetical protein